MMSMQGCLFVPVGLTDQLRHRGHVRDGTRVLVPWLADRVHRLGCAGAFSATLTAAPAPAPARCAPASRRSEEHTSELQSLMRISYAVFCLNKKRQQQ